MAPCRCPPKPAPPLAWRCAAGCGPRILSCAQLPSSKACRAHPASAPRDMVVRGTWQLVAAPCSRGSCSCGCRRAPLWTCYVWQPWMRSRPAQPAWPCWAPTYAPPPAFISGLAARWSVSLHELGGAALELLCRPRLPHSSSSTAPSSTAAAHRPLRCCRPRCQQMSCPGTPLGASSLAGAQQLGPGPASAAARPAPASDAGPALGVKGPPPAQASPWGRRWTWTP